MYLGPHDNKYWRHKIPYETQNYFTALDLFLGHNCYFLRIASNELDVSNLTIT